LPFDVFEGAYIDTGIQILTSASHSEDIYVLDYPKDYQLPKITEDDERWQQIPWTYMREEPGQKLYLSRLLYEILRKMRTDTFQTLGDITDSCQGIVESFYDYSDTKSTMFPLEYRNVDAYRYDEAITERKYIQMTNDDSLYEYYTSPRVLIRRIVSRSDRLMAINAKAAYVVKKDLNPFILLNSDLSVDYLLALINSKMLSFLYTGGSTASLRDDFRQTTLGELKALPIRRITFTTPQERREQLAEKGRKLYQRCLSEGHACVLEFVAHHLAQDETDVIHDLLAFLAQQMIDLNKQKQMEMSRWLAWLEAQIGASVSDFDGKSFIQGYLGDYQKGEEPQAWDKIVEQLEKSKNRKLMSVNIKDKALQGKIRIEYEQSLEALRPPKTQLKTTDDLIDRVVYLLYGLTEDEIAIVERHDTV
jgi:hypothetical protein